MTLVGCDDRKGFRRMEEGTEEKKSETALRCVAPRGGRRMNEEHHSPGRQAGCAAAAVAHVDGVSSRHKLARKGVRLTYLRTSLPH